MEDDAAFLEGSFVEGLGGFLEDDGGGGGGIADDGDLVEVLDGDELFDDDPGFEDPFLEVVEVEVVGVAEILELPLLLCSDDGGREAYEPVVVDASNG